LSHKWEPGFAKSKKKQVPRANAALGMTIL
jgi:hypothetical protein